MGKKADRRKARDQAQDRGESSWVEIGGRPNDDVRALLEELHTRYSWLSRVDDRAIRIEVLGGGAAGPSSVRVSVRGDHVPAGWRGPGPAAGAAGDAEP
jgi:hypothetical protein